jgi:ectoine hydroxylase-related dioxygenase (phytanoyl-CoA dioxygenase family)
MSTTFPETGTTAQALPVSVEEYRTFREHGYLVKRAVLPPSDVDTLLAHIDDLRAGRVDLPLDNAWASGGEDEAARLERLLRIHMLHRQLPLHESYLLHPRLLDVVEALAGPDVLALQTMLFVKGPGAPGQGWHQDTYYIPTQPDTLVGAWVALDEVDEENGCLFVAPTSQHEPVYPDGAGDDRRGGDASVAGIPPITGASSTDPERNMLTPIVARYRQVPVRLQPGDAVFFGGHLFHRSYDNSSATRLRRAFVAHYCNARSAVPWDHDEEYDGEMANDRHILARGWTTLPYAAPRFGTPVTLRPPAARRGRRAVSVMGAIDGGVRLTEHGDPALDTE